MQSKQTSRQRLVFFDNLRYFMVLLVIVFHAGASYTPMVAFWPFHESTSSNLVEVITILLDTFMMTILFFIAGYFALPSLQKKGGKRFIIDKLIRLGIPWLVVIVGVLPMLDYLHYFTQVTQSGAQPIGYGSHWLLSMKKILELTTGRMHMTTYLNMTEHFYQRYMWFVSLLLLFFVIFWFLAEVKDRWFPKNTPRELAQPSTKKSVYTAIAITGVASILIFAGVKILASSPKDPMDLVWFSLGNIFQFQLAKLAFYIPAFVLGIYAYSRKWFANGQNLTRPGMWGLSVFILMVVNMLVARTMLRSENPSLVLQVAFLVLYPLWTLSFLGLFISFAVKHWNTPSTFNREMASNSFYMYLAHYVFVMTLPLLLSGWVGVHILVKYGFVTAASIILSFVTSRYLIKPHPRAMVAGLTGLNILLAIIS